MDYTNIKREFASSASQSGPWTGGMIAAFMSLANKTEEIEKRLSGSKTPAPAPAPASTKKKGNQPPDGSEEK